MLVLIVATLPGLAKPAGPDHANVVVPPQRERTERTDGEHRMKHMGIVKADDSGRT